MFIFFYRYSLFLNNIILYMIKLKFVLLGEMAVGKTSFMIQFNNNKFFNYLDSTIGAAFSTKVIKRNNKNIKLEFWDTAGQERYNSLIPMYIRDCDIVILTFDLTNRDSFKNLEKWRKFVFKNYDLPNIIIVGNKADLELYIKIEQAEIEEYLEKNFCKKPKFFRTSALENINISNLFDYVFDVSKDIIETKKIEPKVIFDDDEDLKINKCCNIL